MEVQRAIQEMIGTKAMEQDTDIMQPEQLVVQVSQMNTLSTHHRGTQSHASGTENRDTSACHVSYQKFIATTAEHQTFINEDQNRWKPKSAKQVDISMVFMFSFGTFIKGLENTFVRPQWN